MDKIDYLPRAIQLADDNLAKVDDIQAKWDTESLFNEWHSKPQQTVFSR